MMRPWLVALGWLLAAPAASASDFKDFRDWHAACDNRRNCVAFGFDTDSAGYTWLRLERGGAPDAPATVKLAVYAEDGVKFRLRFDDPSLPGLPAEALSGDKSDNDDYRRVTLATGDALIASMRKANRIVVTREDPPGAKPSDPRVSEISLSGAVAALLWIDEQQKRLGTVTALIRRGEKPASSVPPPPKAPLVAAAKPPAEPAPEPHPAAILAKGRALCDDDDQSELDDVQPLGSGRFFISSAAPVRAAPTTGRPPP